MTHFGFFITEKLREIIHLEPLWEKKQVIKQTATLPRVFRHFLPSCFFIVHLKGDPIIWFSIIWPDYKSTDMILWVCFSILRTHVLWVCLCVQRPSSSSSCSSVFEPSLLHSMALGIQIAIKGLSVSSWCSIDLQQESNPDYEVQ